MSPAETRAKRAEQRILNNPTVETPVPGAASTRHSQFDTAYSHTLFSQAGTLAKPAWSDSTKGRAVIRMFSRGIVGAAFFTIGGRIARRQMAGYTPEEFKFNFETLRETPLQFLAKGFDTVYGKPIAAMVRTTSRARGLGAVEAEAAAWNATHFRTKAYYQPIDGLIKNGHPMNGRSLGAEMVGITFDFASASVGDASARNLVQMFDPNIRKVWMVNDKGETAQDGEKSHFNLRKFVGFGGKTAWRIFSNNQGEDWFAALPYVYQMKAQRGLMTHMMGSSLKGSKIMFDHAWNGAAYKINDQGQITGDYQLAGAVDLHARFVGYNVYTLIFREGYDAIAKNFKNWKDSGYHLNVHLPEHPLGAVGKGVTDSVRYLAKSFIKANIYMNPAVIPFWLMRVPQTKWRGALINPHAGEGVNAVAARIPFDERVGISLNEYNAVHAPRDFATMKEAMLNPKGYEHVQNYHNDRHRYWPVGEEEPFMFMGSSPEKIPSPIPYNAEKAVYDPYSKEMYKNYEPGADTFFSKMLNPFGKLSYWVGGKASKVVDLLPNKGEGTLHHFISDGKASSEMTMRHFVDASMSYTPYMFAKAETALRVDDRTREGGGKMDKAIYKFIDNVTSFNPGGVKDSVKEIYHLTRQNHDLKSREWKPDSDTPAIPATTVQPEGRALHDPAALSRADDAPDAADRSWAESVAGRNLAAQFQAPSPVRH